MFSVEQDGFFAVSSWGKGGIRDLCVSLQVFFGTVKLIKFKQWCPFAYLENFQFFEP